jgi:hypothetical protein
MSTAQDSEEGYSSTFLNVLFGGAEDFGIRALLIHARDEIARDWYMYQAEFVPSPTDPLHLFLHLKQVRPLLQG